MKKLIYSLFAVLALNFSFASCSDDNEDENIKYSTTAEQASAGTYNGTWSKTADDGTVTTYNGSVTLSAGSSTGVTNVTFLCTEADINATSVANVWNAGHGFKFVNQIVDNNPTNGLGAAFSGSVNESGVLSTSFTLTQKQGRVTVTNIFNFIGNK